MIFNYSFIHHFLVVEIGINDFVVSGFSITIVLNSLVLNSFPFCLVLFCYFLTVYPLHVNSVIGLVLDTPSVLLYFPVA